MPLICRSDRAEQGNIPIICAVEVLAKCTGVSTWNRAEYEASQQRLADQQRQDEELQRRMMVLMNVELGHSPAGEAMEEQVDEQLVSYSDIHDNPTDAHVPKQLLWQLPELKKSSGLSLYRSACHRVCVAQS